MFLKRLVLSGVAMVAAFSLFGCGGSSKPPSVAVVASATTVDATNTVTLTATVTNDKNTGSTPDGVTWTVSGGGALSNTTATSATFTAPAATSSPQSVTVTATSVADTSKTGTITLTVPAKLTVTTTATQLTGAVGAVFSLQLTTSTGISPYKWTLDQTSAALPSGWSLSSTGLLTGPAPVAGQAGTYDLVFDVTDSGTPTPMTASQALTLTVTPATPIAFSGLMPATATYNTAYIGSAAATGGIAPLVYSANGLPGWLILNASTGAVAGTPTTVGPFNFSITAADAFGDSNTQAYTITVSTAAQTITFANPGTQTVGTPLTLSATASSGLAVSFASTTPAVCTVSGTTATMVTSGACSITATQAGNTDYAAATQVSQNFTVNGEAQSITFGTIATQTVGGTPLTLSATASSGLTVSFASETTAVCTVSGTTATMVTSGTCTIQATQAGNSTYAAATPVSQSFTVNGEAQTITFANPGTQYQATPLTLSATSDSGLAVSLASTTTGVCTVSGTTATFVTAGTCTIQATQAGNSTYAAATPVSQSFTVEGTLTISPSITMPTGVVGTAYSQPLTATGGTGAGTYTWSLISGSSALSSLGLSFTGGSTATVAGTTPIQGGPASFTVQVADTGGHTVQATLSVTINASLAISTSTLSPSYVYAGTTGYSQTITALGGASPYTWSVTSGSAALTAAGLSLGSSTSLTNTISGNVPSNATPGPVSFTVQVQDANGVKATQSYTLTVYGALTLTPPSGALAPATTGQTYSGATITASGGSGSYSWTVGTGLPSGMTATPSGGTLTISGTAPATPTTINFTVTLTDTTTGKNLGPISYSIVVSSPTPLALTPNPSPLPTGIVGQSYNGTITASGGSGTYTSFQVMVGSTLTTVPSAGNGQLLVADGISVSMQGTNILVVSGTPASPGAVALDVTVNDSASDTLTQNYTITVVNPSAGNTVSGTVSYSGSLTGWVYLQLMNTNCTGCDGNLGTAINGSGAFTIQGVPAGTYTLHAYMDNTSTDPTTGEVMGGYGAMNASNPTGVGGSNITVTSGPVTGANVTLTAPTAPTLGTATPTWNPSNGFGVFSGGAAVSFSPICNGGGCNNGGIEIPNSYIVQWSTSASFGTVAGSQCFPATGAQQPWIVSGISGTGPYYFRAAGVLGSCNSGTVGNYSAASPSAYTIANPTAGYQVTGTVSWTGTATGPLYVGFYDQSTGNIYATVEGSKASPPTSGVSYSLNVPAGSNYINFGTIDQNNDGLMVPGAISNSNEKLSQVTVISGNTDVGNLALPSGNGMASVLTNSNQQTDINGNVSTGYGLDLRVIGLAKQPASVELYSGPSYLQVTPADIATEAFYGNTDEWNYYPSASGSTPSTSDVFTFNVTYTDGTSNSTANSPSNPITGSPTALLSAWTTNMLPAWNTTGVSTTPNFSWSYPTGASSYTYQFQLQDSNYNTIWSIPTQHSQSSGFASTVSPSITWGVDPTGGGSTPSVPSLSGSSTYYWQIQVTDSNGNEATTQMAFQTAASTLTLPASGPGNALVSTPYGAAINASGGSGSGYVFTVNGTSVPTTGSGSAVSFTGGDGLTVYSTGGNTLWISGTPTTAGSFTLSVTVTDSLSDTASQTYTLNVLGAPSGINNANLNGTYVCKVDGYYDASGARFSTLASIPASGTAGTFSNGIFDSNSRNDLAAVSGTLSGTYNIGADNNGLLTLDATLTSGGTGSQTTQWALALNNSGTSGTVASELRMIEIDDVGTTPSGQHGTGVCYLATTGAFATSTVSSKSFAFGARGEDGSGVPKAFVGRLTNSTESATGGTGGAAGGTFTSGYIDGMKVSQTTDQGGAVTGSYTAPSTTTGRYTLSMKVGSKTLNFAGYIIDINRMFLLETDAAQGLLAGDVRTQQQSSYSAANLDGAAVLYGQAYDGYNGSSVTGYDSQVFQTSSTGNGTLTVDQSYDNNQGTYAAGAENGASVAIAFDSANPGRATFSPGGSSESAFLYFFNTNEAFYLDLNGTNAYLETGWLEAQSGTFTNAGIAGTYMLGKLPSMEANTNDSAGELTAASTGSITANVTNAGEGEFSWDQAQSGMSYSWLSSTYGSFSLSGTGGGGTTCMVVSATNSVCMDNTSSSANMSILQQ